MTLTDELKRLIRLEKRERQEKKETISEFNKSIRHEQSARNRTHDRNKRRGRADNIQQLRRDKRQLRETYNQKINALSTRKKEIRTSNKNDNTTQPIPNTRDKYYLQKIKLNGNTYYLKYKNNDQKEKFINSILAKSGQGSNRSDITFSPMEKRDYVRVRYVQPEYREYFKQYEK